MPSKRLSDPPKPLALLPLLSPTQSQQSYPVIFRRFDPVPAMATTSPARCSPVPAPWRSRRRGSTTVESDPDTGERQRFTSAILPPWCRNSSSPPQLPQVIRQLLHRTRGGINQTLRPTHLHPR
jgi:hypothetical protein